LNTTVFNGGYDNKAEPLTLWSDTTTQLSVQNLSSNTTELELQIASDATIGSYNFSVIITEETGKNTQNFPVYLTIVANGTIPILSFDNTNQWTQVGTTLSTFRRTYTMSNTGGTDAVNCTFRMTDGLQSYVDQNESLFTISAGGSKGIEVLVRNPAVGIYQDYLILDCNNENTGDIVSTSTNPQTLFVITASSSSGQGGGGQPTPTIIEDIKEKCDITVNPEELNFNDIDLKKIEITNNEFFTYSPIVIIEDDVLVSVQGIFIPLLPKATQELTIGVTDLSATTTNIKLISIRCEDIIIPINIGVGVLDDFTLQSLFDPLFQIPIRLPNVQGQSRSYTFNFLFIYIPLIIALIMIGLVSLTDKIQIGVKIFLVAFVTIVATALLIVII
jgi:hypothetical protein